MRCLSLILILTVTFVASCFAKLSRSSASHCKTHASRETAAPHAELHDSSFACSFVALHSLFYQRSYPSVFGAVKFASFHYSLLVGFIESRDVCAASAIERIIGDSSGLPLESYTKTTPPGWQTGHVHYPFIRYLERLRLWYRLTDVLPEQVIGKNWRTDLRTMVSIRIMMSASTHPLLSFATCIGKDSAEYATQSCMVMMFLLGKIHCGKWGCRKLLLLMKATIVV
jgi:hypothetical protein